LRAADREFRGRVLGDGDGARLLGSAHDLGGALRDPAVVDLRPAGGGHTLDVDHVLDPERDALQRAGRARTPSPGGFLSRAVADDGDHGVQYRVHRGDAGTDRGEDLHRCCVAGPVGVEQLG
jgi:hypothetical protein